MPYDKRDDETQQFTPTYADKDILECVRDLEVAGTQDVSDTVGCTTENARVRLNKLVERGELAKREIGGKNVYFFSE